MRPIKLKNYEQEIKTYEQQLNQLQRQFKLLGFGKLLHVAFVCWFIYQLFTGVEGARFLSISGFFATLLTIFWIKQARIKEKINHANGLLAINKRHINRISGKWVNFADIGSEFIDANHPYSSDLDIVGKKSLFQFINTTHTWHGRNRFASDLLAANYTSEKVNKRQEAILELSEDIIFSNEAEFRFEKIGVFSASSFIADRLNNQDDFMKHNALKALVLYGPMVVFFFVATTWFIGEVQLMTIGGVLLILQGIIFLMTTLKTTHYLNDVSGLSYNLGAYSGALKLISSRTYQSEKLNHIKRTLHDDKAAAAAAIKELDIIANGANLKRHFFPWLLFNMFLLRDLTTALRFEAWKKKYASFAPAWFEALGEFESLLAFSHLKNVLTTVCIPTLTMDKLMTGSSVGHPLIANEKRVLNDVYMNDNIFIVSGSNMSGKTTFMRTIGINIVLAKAGAFTCATHFTTAPFNVITSMRIADDLSEGVSTFYAELINIKKILKLAQTDALTFFLIDEIFRGTNSTDRLYGAKAVLEKLASEGVLGLITTHDLELCELTKHVPTITNYNFKETYTNNEITFDYKLRAGISSSTNAKHLMALMDIL